MSNQNKKILFKSRPMFMGMVIIGWGFMLVGIFGHNFWVAVFFGCIALYTIYPFLNPNVKVVWIGTKEFDEEMQKQSEESYNDLGIFTYTEDGFHVLLQKDEEDVKWEDFESIVAYKLDNMTTDTICMDIFCTNSNAYRFTEEMKGWRQFQTRLLEKFPQINRTWEMEIASPAFKTNYTLLYSKNGQTLEQVLAEKYKEK